MIKELLERFFPAKSRSPVINFRPNTELRAYAKLDPIVESIMLGMLNVCPKLVLTGSTVLSTTRILSRAPGDLDFGIREPLTEGDIKILMDFFNLEERNKVDRYGDVIEKYRINQNLQTDSIICLIYILPNSSVWGADKLKYIKIDIFTKEKLNGNEIVKMDYFGHKLDVAHPSIPLSYKMRYAINPQIGAREKHKDDLMNVSPYYESIVKDLVSIARLNQDDHTIF